MDIFSRDLSRYKQGGSRTAKARLQHLDAVWQNKYLMDLESAVLNVRLIVPLTAICY